MGQQKFGYFSGYFDLCIRISGARHLLLSIANGLCMMKTYKSRIVDEMLQARLRRKGAVLIEGAKWCGKTTTAEQQAASVLYMADPEVSRMADVSIKRLLKGDRPRLLDEWQVAPAIWDAVRFDVDHSDSMGQFILTGSSVPPQTSAIMHSGVGRFAKLLMRPMSLFESGESNGEVSLSALFNSEEDVEGENSMDIDHLAFLICRGGWPGAIGLSDRDALGQAFDYFDIVTDSDVSRVDGVVRDPIRVRSLMRSYARHQGAGASVGTILADIKTNDSSELSDNTVYDYIRALKRTFVIEDMPAWNPNIRSKTAIRTSDTRYFIDPCIGTAALGLGPNDLINDLETMGLMFETLCIRDLRVYAESIDGSVYHYRDKNGLECDAVIHLRNGSYGLVEIKLGGDKLIEEGAKTLRTLAALIDTTKMKSPSFMMVLTGVGRYAYRRPDGIFVVPIACLRN